MNGLVEGPTLTVGISLLIGIKIVDEFPWLMTGLVEGPALIEGISLGVNISEDFATVQMPHERGQNFLTLHILQ